MLTLHKTVNVYLAATAVFLASLFFSDNLFALIIRTLLGFTICFYIIGDVCKRFLRKLIPIQQGNTIYEFSLSTILSFSIFSIVSVVLSSLYLLETANIVLALLVPLLLFCTIGLLRKTDVPFHFNKNKIIPVMIVLLFGFILSLIFRRNFVWPEMPGWDTYVYLGGANWIYNSHGSAEIFYSSSSTIAPPASYLFQIMIASFAHLTGLSPFMVLWGGPFLATALFGVLVYLLAYSVSKNAIFAVVSSLLCLLIPGSDLFLGPQYFLPSTVSLLLFLVIANYLINLGKLTKLSIVFMATFLSIYYAMYYFPIIITLPLLVILALTKSKRLLIEKNMTVVAGLLLVLMIIGSYGGSLLIEPTTRSLESKFALFIGEYSYLLLFLFLLGALFTFTKNTVMTSKYKFLLLAYTISMIVVFFLPPFVTLRTEEFLRCFLVLFAAIPLVEIIGLINNGKS